MKVVFTRAARRHLRDLRAYIGEHGQSSRADGYIRRIVAFCDGLARFPLRGVPRDDLMPGLRSLSFERRVVVVYVVVADQVVIEGADYGSRSLEGARE